MYRMGIFWEVAKISNIFLGMPRIPDFFFVNSRYWVQAYVASKIESTPAPGGFPTQELCACKLAPYAFNPASTSAST